MNSALRHHGRWLLLFPTFVVLSALVLALVLARGRGMAAPTANATIPPGLAAVAHAFKDRYAPGEAVSLLVAFGNTGKEALYLAAKDDFTLPYMLVVKNARGETVSQRVPLTDPGPPPSDHYLLIKGQEVLVTPLVEVKSGEAVAAILPDVLAVYQPLEPGKYTIQVITGFSSYEQENVLRRTDHPHALWTRAGTRSRSLQMDAGTVTIDIAEP